MDRGSTIDLRRLRYFLAVADAAGFRQAAAVLGIAQPPLSQQIMALEKQVGERLFIRHARKIEMTDAGRALVAEARLLLARAAEIPERLRRAATGKTGTLRIGFTPALAHHPLLPRLLREFRFANPEIDLCFQETDIDALCRDLVTNRIQVAFIRPTEAVQEQLLVETLARDPLMLAIPVGHRLAHRSAVRLAEVADEDFVMFERVSAPDLYDTILAACVEAGFSMRIVHHAPQKVAAMMLVAAASGIAIVPAALGGVHAEAIRLIAFEGVQPVAHIEIATRKGEQSVLPMRFRRFCLERQGRNVIVSL